MTSTATTTDSPTSTIKTPRTKVMRSKVQWKALLDESRRSELTKTDFCKMHKMSAGSLHKWQKYLDLQHSEAEFIDITEPLNQAKSAQPVHTREHQWQVELELGSGVILRVRTH